jgi:hypothetical protein
METLLVSYISYTIFRNPAARPWSEKVFYPKAFDEFGMETFRIS